MAFKAIEEQIRAIYGELSAVERKLADVVVARGKDLPAYNATELASAAGVSKASAARFFRRLGYEDFNAFRQHVRTCVSAESPLHQLDQAAGASRAGLADHLRADSLRLAALHDHLAGEVLERALGLLASARNVWVVGYRNSFMLAFYAQSLLAQVRPGVCQLQDPAGREAELLCDLSTRDVVLLMDMRRRTRRLEAIARVAADAGTPLILLTDQAVSRLAGQAAAVLSCPGGEGRVFDSYVAPVSLVNHLATELADRARRQARGRLARIEHLHELLNDLH